MKLPEAENLIKEWKECVDRIDLAETIRNETSEETVTTLRSTNGCFYNQINLTEIEATVLMNTLVKRLQEREKFLRERIEKELGIELED